MATLKIKKASESASALSKMQEYEICFSGFPKKDVRVPISQKRGIRIWGDAPHFEALFSPINMQWSKFLETIFGLKMNCAKALPVPPQLCGNSEH